MDPSIAERRNGGTGVRPCLYLLVRFSLRPFREISGLCPLRRKTNSSQTRGAFCDQTVRHPGGCRGQSSSSRSPPGRGPFATKERRLLALRPWVLRFVLHRLKTSSRTKEKTLFSCNRKGFTV